MPTLAPPSPAPPPRPAPKPARAQVALAGALALVLPGCQPIGACLPDGHPPFLEVDAPVTAAELAQAGIGDPATATAAQCRDLCR